MYKLGLAFYTGGSVPEDEIQAASFFSKGSRYGTRSNNFHVQGLFDGLGGGKEG